MHGKLRWQYIVQMQQRAYCSIHTAHFAGSSVNTIQDLHTVHCAGSSANRIQNSHALHTVLAVVQTHMCVMQN